MALTPVDGRKTVAAAGTREALSSTDLIFEQLDVQALETNTKPVTIGAVTVVHGGAAATGRRGITLNAGETYSYIQPVNLGAVYADVEVNGEGVKYHGIRR